MALTFDAWLRDVDRRAIDNSPGFTPQCTDLWRDYLIRVLGAPWGVGHAKSYAWQLWTLFESDPDRPGDWLVRVAAKASALPGDGVVWGTGLYDPTGHVAVVIADLGDRLRVMNQNYAGHPYAEVSVISKKHVLGYLRPRVKTSNPKPAETAEQREERELMGAREDIINYVEAAALVTRANAAEAIAAEGRATRAAIDVATSRMRREARPVVMFVSEGADGRRYSLDTSPYAAAVQPASGFILPLNAADAHGRGQVRSLKANGYRIIAQDDNAEGQTEATFFKNLGDIMRGAGILGRDADEPTKVAAARALFGGGS